MNLHESIGELLARDLDVVTAIARDLRVEVWLVGGPVRDALLRREVRDLDFLLQDRFEELVHGVAKELSGSILFHPEFLTATVTLPSGRVIDFTTARTERYPSPGDLPIVQPATLDEDLHRRDFTINAIAWNCISGEILDPFHGRKDLDERTIRVLHDASFIDDPTRIFRAIRLATRLHFELEPDTERLLREAAEARALRTVSPQRIWREVTLAFEESSAPRTLARLIEDHVLLQWLGASNAAPELEERLGRLAALLREDLELDAEILYLATILAACDDNASVPIEISARRLALLRRLTARSTERLAQWQSLADDEARARFCLEHEPEEIVFIAARIIDAEDSHRLVDTCRAVRSTKLPFTGADLDVPPGPHIGRALRDARVRAWIGGLGPAELLSFAREAALRYLNDQT